MVRRLMLLMMVVVTCGGGRAQTASLNIDVATIGAMTGAYESSRLMEHKTRTYFEEGLEHYNAGFIATAGIFVQKQMERKALRDIGFLDSNENYYYRRIWSLVHDLIMPKVLSVAYLMVKHPEEALYWGPYLFKVTEDVRQLCMIFETVVTNNAKSFANIDFLQIEKTVMDYFDLTKFGNIQWRQLWEDFANIPQSIQWEDIGDDLDDMVGAAVSFATAGSGVVDSLLTGSLTITKVFKNKPAEWKAIYSQFKGPFGTLMNPASMKSEILSRIGGTDSSAVEKLLHIGSYKVSDFANDYMKGSKAKKEERQRWYIVGTQEDCDATYAEYTPAANDTEMYRLEVFNGFSNEADLQNAYDNAYKEARQLSEKASGWDEQRVQQLNSSSNGEKYTITYENMNPVIVNVFNNGLISQDIYYFGVKIKVGRCTVKEVTVHEEWYDSKAWESKSAFTQHMQEQLNNFRSSEPENTFELRYDTAQPYSLMDEKSAEGIASVTFRTQCHGSVEIMSGTHSWKEDEDQPDCIEDCTRDEYAMFTSVSDGGAAALQEINDSIAYYEQEAATLKKEIDTLDDEISALADIISNGSFTDIQDAKAQRDALRKERNTKQQRYDTMSSYINQMKAARDGLIADHQTDQAHDEYRIPYAMALCENAYGLSWTDSGGWEVKDCEKSVFVRHAKMDGVDGMVTFRCELTMSREESWFIIRYHRAILVLDWKLTGDYDSNDVVDVMDVDPSLSAADKAALINTRHDEIQQANPGCLVTSEYEYLEAPKDSAEVDMPHLLWLNERIDIARSIEERLTNIYVRLVYTEKFLQLRAFRSRFIHDLRTTIGLTRDNHKPITNKALKTWMNNAKTIAKQAGP